VADRCATLGYVVRRGVSGTVNLGGWLTGRSGRVGLVFVEKALTTDLTSTDTTERNTGMLFASGSSVRW
jgi:hypothetical protein